MIWIALKELLYIDSLLNLKGSDQQRNNVDEQNNYVSSCNNYYSYVCLLASVHGVIAI